MTFGLFLRSILGIKLGVLVQHEPREMVFQESLPFPNRIAGEEFPKICIVTPSLNQGSFIGATLASIDAENYPNLVHIIQDCVSTDETSFVLAQYAKPYRKVYSEKDLGQADAINRGFARTDAPIMAYLNSDDTLLPGAIWAAYRAFLENPSVEVVYGNRVLIDASGNEIGRWELPKHCEWTLRATDYVPQETLFWRRTVWERAGGKISCDYKFAIDWDLLLRFVEVDAKFLHLQRLMGAFRVHHNQKTRVDIRSIGFAEITQIRTRVVYSPLIKTKIVAKHLLFLLQHVLLVHFISFKYLKARRHV